MCHHELKKYYLKMNASSYWIWNLVNLVICKNDVVSFFIAIFFLANCHFLKCMQLYDGSLKLMWAFEQFLFQHQSPPSIATSGWVMIACPLMVCCCASLCCHKKDYHHSLFRYAQTLMVESSIQGDHGGNGKKLTGG